MLPGRRVTLLLGSLLLGMPMALRLAADAGAAGTGQASQQWSTGRLSQARESFAVGTVGSTVIFAGGYVPRPDRANWESDRVSRVVDLYDAAAGRWSTANLLAARTEATAV